MLTKTRTGFFLFVRSVGLEPTRRFQHRSSTYRVCQFRHERSSSLACPEVPRRVPKAGFEPTIQKWNTVLNRARLPVPPLRQAPKPVTIISISRNSIKRRVKKENRRCILYQKPLKIQVSFFSFFLIQSLSPLL